MAQPCDGLFAQKAASDQTLTNLNNQIQSKQVAIDAAYFVIQAAEAANPGPATSATTIAINARVAKLTDFIAQYNAINALIADKGVLVAQQGQAQANATIIVNALTANGCYQQ